MNPDAGGVRLLVAGLPWRMATLCHIQAAAALLVFVALTMFIQTYWVQVYDLMTTLFVLLLLAIWLSRIPRTIKVISNIVLFVLWQFTFEEIIFLPVFYAINYNVDWISSHFDRRRGLKSVLARRLFFANGFYLSLAVLSQAITLSTRNYFFSGADTPGGAVVLGQWIMFQGYFLKDLFGEIQVLLTPSKTLWTGPHWLQGSAILALFLFVFMPPCIEAFTHRTNVTAMKLAVFVCFVFLITVTFADPAQTNTFMPLVVVIFLFLAEVHLPRRPGAGGAPT